MYSFNYINVKSAICQAVTAFLLFLSGCNTHPIAEGHPGPIIGPDVLSFGNLEPVTIIYQPLATVQPQNGLPAREGAVFEGPDPGLNAFIIDGPDCPDNRKRDPVRICRRKFDYGPNPFSPIIPQTFKGSLQFYMGLQVGNTNNRFNPRWFPLHHRGRHRKRIKGRKRRPLPLPASQNDDDDD